MCALKTCPRDLMTPYCQLIELTQLSDFYLLFSVIISFANYVSNTTLIFISQIISILRIFTLATACTVTHLTDRGKYAWQALGLSDMQQRYLQLRIFVPICRHFASAGSSCWRRLPGASTKSKSRQVSFVHCTTWLYLRELWAALVSSHMTVVYNRFAIISSIYRMSQMWPLVYFLYVKVSLVYLCGHFEHR